MDGLMLPLALEQFVAEAVAAGRYGSADEVVRVALSVLQRYEAARETFRSSLAEAEAESERDGFLAAEDVHREMAGLLEDIAAQA